MQIDIPELSLVLLLAPSGAGKSTFAKAHFRPTEILSSDTFRALISDDEANQAVTPQAFALLSEVATQRLRLGRLVVVDATNLRPDARQPYLALAKRFYVATTVIVLDLDEALCQERNAGRTSRQVPPAVITNHHADLRRSLSRLDKEGFHRVYTLSSPQAVAASVVNRVPMPADRRADDGPFDIIGDVHGCFAELCALLDKLGYQLQPGADPATAVVRHPQGRRVVFLGDLVDRGPQVLACVKLAAAMVRQGVAIALLGNHEAKVLRYLRGAQVQPTHGLQQTITELASECAASRAAIAEFLASLPTHLVLARGGLVVAHAGLPEAMHGRDAGAVHNFALYGATTGENDALGYPVRGNWAATYRGKPLVVYGHTPVAAAVWENNTLCIDTGCVFGGSLSALRYPERELVSVPALQTYVAR